VEEAMEKGEVAVLKEIMVRNPHFLVKKFMVAQAAEQINKLVGQIQILLMEMEPMEMVLLVIEQEDHHQVQNT
jgi:hypothetical protein